MINYNKEGDPIRNRLLYITLPSKGFVLMKLGSRTPYPPHGELGCSASLPPRCLFTILDQQQLMLYLLRYQ